MSALAIDTCFRACSVSLVASDGRHADRYDVIGRGHAEIAVEMLRDVARELAVDLGEIKTIAVTTGPGTFTGQRVGVALAQGLAIGSHARLYAASSLQAIAATVLRKAARKGIETGQGRFGVIVDAGRDAFYWQVVSHDGAVAASPSLLDHAALSECICTFDGPILGPAAGKVAGSVPAWTELHSEDGEVTWADACDLHSLAQSGKLKIVPQLRPNYLRRPDAEPNRHRLPRQFGAGQ